MKKITLLGFLFFFSLFGYSQGEDCVNPIVISSLPYNTTDDTSNYGDNYDTADRPALGGEQYVNGTGSASYLTGDDAVYSFTPTVDGVYSFDLSNTIDDWIGFWLFEGCPFTSIVARHTAISGTTRSLPNLNLVNGTTYYVVISTWASPQSTPYTLDVTQITCPSPSDLDATNIMIASADLSWVENGTASLYNVEVVMSGDTPTGTPTDTGVVSGFTKSGLAPATDYEFYVQADCTGGDTSVWVGPFAFTTACDIFTPDYVADMSVNVPNCWEEANSGDATTGPMDLGAGLWYGSNHNGTPSNAINLWTDTRSDWIISPEFDLSSAAPSELNIYVALTENSTNGSGADLGSDDSVDLLMTTDGGTTWTSMQTWTQGNVPTDIGEQITYDLSAISGTVQFAFLGDEGDVDDTEDVYFHVSQFRVRETPSCLEPNTLTATTTSISDVDVTWVAGGSETDWTYEYGISPYVQGGGGTTGTVSGTPSLNLSGLTPGETYDIYVQTNCSGSDSIYISTQWTQPLEGEECSTAFVASVEADCSTATPLSLDFDAGGSETLPSCDLSGNTGYWVEVTTPANGVMNLYLSGSASNIGLAIFDACGGSEVFCANNNLGASTELSGLLGSTTYYMYFWQDSASGVAELCFEEVNCSAPTDLDATILSATSAELSWTEGGSETEWNIELVDVTGGGSATGTATSTGVTNPVTISSLVADNDYEYYVQADCGGATSTWVGPFSFYTGYCPSETTSIDGTGITNLQVGNTDFASGGTISYENFTGSPVDLAQGIVSNIQITFDTGYSYGVNIWIDFNDNLTFEASELLFTGEETSGVNGVVYNASFLMPVSAALGTHRMRIVTDDTNTDAADPCNSTTWHVTMDVDVNIIVPTCTPSEVASSSISEDCVNTQFYVEVDVTTVGDATQISDGASTYPISGTGITQVGPFASGDSVTLTVEHSDASCDYSLGVFSYTCPPMNDDLAGAIALTVDEGFCNGSNTNGTNEGATDSGEAVGSCYYNGADNDVWFSFTVPSGTATVDVSTDFTGGTLEDTQIAVYSGMSGSLVEMDCSQDEGTTILGNGSSWNSIITDLAVTVGETYYVQVDGYDFDLMGTFCLDISTNQVLGVDDIDNPAAFTYYPNPVKNTLTLNAQNNIDSVVMYNMLGQEVLRTIPNAIDSELDMSQLNSGTYFVQVTIANTTKTVRVIKE